MTPADARQIREVVTTASHRLEPVERPAPKPAPVTPPPSSVARVARFERPAQKLAPVTAPPSATLTVDMDGRAKLTVTVTPDARDALRAATDAAGEAVGAVVKRAVFNYLASGLPLPPPPRSPRRRCCGLYIRVTEAEGLRILHAADAAGVDAGALVGRILLASV